MVKMSSTDLGDPSSTNTTSIAATPSTHNSSNLHHNAQNIHHSTTTINSSRNNVSVTNIKCEERLNCPSLDSTTHDSSIPFNSITTSSSSSTISNNYFNGISSSGITSNSNNSGSSGTGNVGIRIAVPKLEESDESESELINIENLNNVNRRINNNKNKNNGPRPMSWEGELSEPENELMDTDNSTTINNHHNQHNNSNHQHNNHHHHHHHDKQFDDTQMSIKEEESKTEFDEITVDDTMLTAQIYSTSLKKFQQQQQLQQQQQHHQQQQQQQQQNNDIVNLKYEPGSGNGGGNISIPIVPISITNTTYNDQNLITNNVTGGGNSGLNSPLLARSKICTTLLPANPSPDSAIHSVYTHSSPSQSPLTSRHAPYTPSLSRNNSDASHSSCYSYSSEFSPTHSPIQGRHNIYGGTVNTGNSNSTNCNNYNGANVIGCNTNSSTTSSSSLHHSVLYRPIIHDNIENISILNRRSSSNNDNNSSNCTASSSITTNTSGNTITTTDILIENDSSGIPSPGISRQQLINSPCPICGDKISGFHYGIFSCESCKGFFKRTVQNRKNYVCVRGGPCPVTISTRKKCPACRFDKCLVKGMKLEAIREDRTRGGRSTYQCSYTLPTTLTIPDNNTTSATTTMQGLLQSNSRMNGCIIKTECGIGGIKLDGNNCNSGYIKTENDAGGGNCSNLGKINTVPTLLQEIMDVEHLWQYNESELSRLNQTSSNISSSSSTAANLTTNALLASAGISSNGDNTNPDLIATLCNVADHRLYKIVKWCKSLPLFKNISIDDQICLLINSWCELLLFSCCFRSIETPGEIKISLGKTITLSQAKTNGLHACVERMINLTDHLRRLRVDRFEYVAMKVIVLLQSDTSELREPVKVRQSQEKALQALQSYTLAHYPETPSKFGELLLRIPELQRTCQLGKEMLTIKSKDGEDFNLLMELLRGEH